MREIESSEDAARIYATGIFDIIEPNAPEDLVRALGVHLSLRDTRFVLVFDKLCKYTFVWQELSYDIREDTCVFSMMDYGLATVPFEYVFEKLDDYIKNKLLYLMDILLENK